MNIAARSFDSRESDRVTKLFVSTLRRQGGSIPPIAWVKGVTITLQPSASRI
jgi:hypothetical protein